MPNGKTFRAVMWRAIGRPGLERAIVEWDAQHVVARGVSVGVVRGEPFSLRYAIHCDAQWRTRWIQVASLISGQTLELHSDGQGRWTNAYGEPHPHLTGCVHPDLSVSPLTNTLPIRHARSRQEATIKTRVVYVELPAMNTEPRMQRYTCLGERKFGSTFRYEGGITTHIDVDQAGLVVHYPNLFERVPLAS